MLKTIIWFGHFALTLIATLPKVNKVRRMKDQGKNDEAEAYVHRTTTKWARAQVKWSGADVKIYGEENLPSPEETVLYIANHQSYFDIALFMSHINLPKGYVAKIEMRKIPILRTWMEFIHCVFMDRSNLRKSAEAIALGIRNLKDGHSMVIFPEGTRSQGPVMGDFKAGSFKLATKPQVPIIPVTINGSYKLMEGNGNRIKADTVELYIHPVINTKGLSKEEIDNLPEKVKSLIASKLTS
ncbi:lysophospholipid acyltransferase family protein [Alloiococcus sp. CFN-8]|uniref:lysophospholipid acyltransferase family protein n=1 Tax=Alloiococcus sp. CFN-8 TaxID=3416081 RepID=UPI003CEA44A2